MTDDPWLVDEQAYPRHAGAAEQLRYLVQYAVLAPSNHNTQPWLFTLARKQMSLFADRSRRLPVVDPDDRELIISCGAALGHLEVAMRHFGREPSVELLPDPARPDLLANIALGTERARRSDDTRLFASIPQRRTTREVFSTQSVPPALIEELIVYGQAEGVIVQVIAEQELRERIATLVADGDRQQFADPAFRAELGAWIHSRRSTRCDGVSADGFEVSDSLADIGSLALRTFDIGRGIAARNVEIAAGSPLLVVLSTSTDKPESWLRTGRVLSRLLLHVTAADVNASYLNQPIEVAGLRAPLAALIKTDSGDACPQLLLRLGYSERARRSARRSIAEVLELPLSDTAPVATR